MLSIFAETSRKRKRDRTQERTNTSRTPFADGDAAGDMNLRKPNFEIDRDLVIRHGDGSLKAGISRTAPA
jgi:hypothetical protein